MYKASRDRRCCGGRRIDDSGIVDGERENVKQKVVWRSKNERTEGR